MLVNRQWFEIGVKIFWSEFTYKFPPLLACIPEESKQIIRDNVTFIPETEFVTPSYNYASCIQVFNINYLNELIRRIIIRYDPENTVNDDQEQFQTYKEVIYRETLKLLMRNAPIRKLNFYTQIDEDDTPHVDFGSFPGAVNTLMNVTTLACCTDQDPRFFQTIVSCKRLEAITLYMQKEFSDGLMDTINAQNNLKDINIQREEKSTNWPVIADSMENHPTHRNTITIVNLSFKGYKSSIRFLRNFQNLTELTLCTFHDYFDDFNELQHVYFPHLRFLSLRFIIPKEECLMKFFEINGKNLETLEIDSNNDELDFAIPRFCPKLKVYGKVRNSRELLENTFDNCRNLESITVTCKNNQFNESQIIKFVGRSMPKNHIKLTICTKIPNQSELLLGELDNALKSLHNYISPKTISLTLRRAYRVEIKPSIRDLIRRYETNGIIKKFKTEEHYSW
ncbi:3353_t:CDS:1 [Funneliformis geosporum]|uniref:5056_t:CDS:1 n=1 Tax=Funneliformis geosporum TaxID=1117311 RepID=A0A9W4SGW8_9GLOM|nr:5056_t:CDS:1 [Funneliformis geosporum]CAI2175288.1 3353_t:CDS:1 [Funneliformis geosporum]